MPIPEVKIAYRVRYQVTGYTKEFETEPYQLEEALVQKQDIAGFEGVHTVYLLPVHDDVVATTDAIVEDEENS